MSPHHTRVETGTWLSRIRVARVLIAALMSEAGVVVILLLAIAVYTRLWPTMAESADLGERIGYYVAPAAGALTVFLSVLWATRRLHASLVMHAVLVGATSALLAAGFMVSARPEHRFMYLVAMALRLVGGAAGGGVAQWRHDSFTQRSTMTANAQEHTR